MSRRVLLLAGLLWSAVLMAADPFYAQQVPVADRSESALGDAAAVALTRILIKVSGDETIGENPTIAKAIADARNRMSLYTYDDSPQGLQLRAEFDDAVVKDILRAGAGTFWGADRAPVLMWLVVDEPYSRRFATVSENGPMLRNMADSFEARGVKLRLPLLDLEDAATLSPEMVWQKYEPRIRTASARYGTPHVLVGRMVQLSSGQVLTDWLYFDERSSKTLQSQGRDTDALMNEAVDLVVDAMAERFAVKLEPVSVYDRLLVSVSGVETYSDYRGVYRVFESIPVLDTLQVAGVDGDTLQLSVSGVGTAKALARLLPPRSRLAIEQVSEGRELALRWGQP